MLGRRAAVVLVLLTTSVPVASADEDPVQHAQGVANAAIGWAVGGVGSLVEALPACGTSDPAWTASCEDGETEIGCRPDASTHYECRLVFEGEGGDVDGWSTGALVGEATETAGEVPGRGVRTASNVAGAGVQVATVAIAEFDSWNQWAQYRVTSARDVAFESKQPYQDAATGFAAGVSQESDDFARRVRDDVERAVLDSVNNGVTADYRFSLGYDSGPVTVEATNRRPADDPCSPGTGLRLFGTDCLGAILVSGQLRGSLACNAYTSIALAQPCGGHVSRDWVWSSDGTPLFPKQLQAARLSLGPDGRVSVHDAFGVLHCRAPRHENGYWVQSFYLNYQQSLFNDHTFGQQNANSVALFGDDAGTCVVETVGAGYRVTYDVRFQGRPIRMTGRFVPEGAAQNLADCESTADTRTLIAATCTGVVHTGGG